MSNICVGFNGGLVDTPKKPIISDKAPTANDYQYKEGQIWIQKNSTTITAVFIFGGVSMSSNGPQGLWAPIGSSSSGSNVVLPTLTGMQLNPVLSNLEQDLEIISPEALGPVMQKGYCKVFFMNEEGYVPVYVKAVEEKKEEEKK